MTGTGPNGRITKEDALAALLRKAESTGAGEAARPQVSEGSIEGTEQTRTPLSSLRKRIAENLVRSQAESAHLTTFNEIDMSEVMSIRKAYREEFESKHGVRLGFMSFFVKACASGLIEFPKANSSLDGSEMITNHRLHIGVAVSTPRGLIVPVLRNADRKRFADIEAEILSFATRAKEKKIGVDELTGGTFTITNGGVFGSLLSTPIPTPGQAAILGMHTIQRRPVAVGESVEIHPMMYVALTYDHRIMDGREAVGFLAKIKVLIEDPHKMLIDL